MNYENITQYAQLIKAMQGVGVEGPKIPLCRKKPNYMKMRKTQFYIYICYICFFITETTSNKTWIKSADIQYHLNSGSLYITTLYVTSIIFLSKYVSSE